MRTAAKFGLVTALAVGGAFVIWSAVAADPRTPSSTNPASSEESGDPQTRGAAGRVELVPPEVVNRWADYPGYQDPDEGLRALAYRFNSPVFYHARANSALSGVIRRGTMVPVTDRVHGPGCRGGGWFELAGGGYVCTSEGFVVSSDPELRWHRYRDLSRVAPYTYAAVTRGAHRYLSLPEADELEGGETLDGDYFVTVVDRHEHLDQTFIRTARGRYVRDSDVEVQAPSKLAGVELASAELELPVAFAYLADAQPVYQIRDGNAVDVGRIHQYARFHVANRREVDGTEFLLAPGGHAVSGEHLRVARRIRRPAGIPANQKWIHVDLSAQTLVAYEGSRPVFATLVASGREGYDTPTGLYQVRGKYISTTMRGADPVDGPYEVEEVPWTMFYYEGFALHGAYWHDAFGQVRSHGCTNLAPHDARWLFEWTSPDLPDGWQGQLRLGTWVHLTRDDG